MLPHEPDRATMLESTIPLELTHRLEAADAREVAIGLQGLAQRLGDEAGVAVGRFGRAVAVVCQCLETSLYNRVIGFDAEALDRIDEIIAFYRDRNVPPRFDIVPELVTDEIASALRKRGFEERTKPIFSNLMMAAAPRSDIPDPPAGIAIREAPREKAALIGTTHAAGLEYPSPAREYLGWQLEARLEDPTACGFLAEIDRRPAATGMLLVTDRIGYFGHASTVHRFRGRGCQTALIQARLKKAAELGCDHVVAFPVPETASHRNLVRCGFELAHRLQIWMDVDADRE